MLSEDRQAAGQGEDCGGCGDSCGSCSCGGGGQAPSSAVAQMDAPCLDWVGAGSCPGGFTAGNGKSGGNGQQPTVYDNPLKPPDFEQLKERFVRGQVLIRVEPRKAKSRDRSA